MQRKLFRYVIPTALFSLFFVPLSLTQCHLPNSAWKLNEISDDGTTGAIPLISVELSARSLTLTNTGYFYTDKERWYSSSLKEPLAANYQVSGNIKYTISNGALREPLTFVSDENNEEALNLFRQSITVYKYDSCELITDPTQFSLTNTEILLTMTQDENDLTNIFVNIYYNINLSVRFYLMYSIANTHLVYHAMRDDVKLFNIYFDFNLEVYNE